VDSKPLIVIGIMPPHFGWNVADIWVPDWPGFTDPHPMDRAFWLQARLKRGIGLEQAQSQLNGIAARLAERYPEQYPKKFTIKVLNVIDWVVGKFRAVLYSLFGAVALLLLIACCNVANMLLSRATAREREISIRAALGATRFQILRQLLVESSILFLCGGILGVALAYGAVKALSYLMPPNTIRSKRKSQSKLWKGDVEACDERYLPQSAFDFSRGDPSHNAMWQTVGSTQ